MRFADNTDLFVSLNGQFLVMTLPDPDSSTSGIPKSSTDGILPHSAYNSCGRATIVFVHGACSSRLEWDLVTPALSQSYHLLIPDLPGHGQSRNITPFSVEYSSRLLAKLIREKAIDGTAHVIGLSLGAHVGIDLASRYPQVVNSMFVSGFEVFPQLALSPYLPYILWVMMRLESFIPRPVVRWLMDGADIKRVDKDVCTLALCRQITNPLKTDRWPSPWPARTLVVAAGKGGMIPSSDHPHDARKLVHIGNQLNSETMALTHPRMRHPWNRQAPLLFAEIARAWFEREELPNEFQRL